MQNLDLDVLDQAELLHLALQAGQAGDAGKALTYLKTAAARGDASAEVHYLLGAEYAELGMAERARDAFEAALALDPSLDTARLQLAMLLLTQQQSERAREVAAVLHASSGSAALRAFGACIEALAAGDASGAQAYLAQGQAANGGNLPLNGAMAHLVAQLAPRSSDGAGEQDTHFLLSAYAGNQRL